jgi:hypothetical protein
MRLEWPQVDLAAMANDLTAAERAEVLERLVHELAGMRSYAAALEQRVAKQQGASHAWDVKNLAMKRSDIATAEAQLAALQQADVAATAAEHQQPPPAQAQARPQTVRVPPAPRQTAEEQDRHRDLSALWLDCMMAARVLFERDPKAGVYFCVIGPHTVYVYLYLSVDAELEQIFAAALRQRYADRLDAMSGADNPPRGKLIIRRFSEPEPVQARLSAAEQLDDFYAAFVELIEEMRNWAPDALHYTVAETNVTYARLVAVNGARPIYQQDWMLHLIVDGRVDDPRGEHPFSVHPVGVMVNILWRMLVRTIPAASSLTIDRPRPVFVRGTWPRKTSAEAEVEDNARTAQLWLTCLQVADERGLTSATEDCCYIVWSSTMIVINPNGGQHPEVLREALLARVRSGTTVDIAVGRTFYARDQFDAFYAGLALFIDHLRTTAPATHGALLGRDVPTPGVTFRTLEAQLGAANAVVPQLCLWTPGEQIDFTAPDGLHPWAAAPPSPIVGHVAAIWSAMVNTASLGQKARPMVRTADGKPVIMRGPGQAERWRMFTGTTFSMRQRVAMIDAVERLYNKDNPSQVDGNFDPATFYHEVLEHPAWLPHVGSILYHGTREESFLGDPDVLRRMRTVTFFSPDAPMSQTYAAHNMLAFRVAHELPHPMVHIQRVGHGQLTHDRLAAVWTPLFGYPKSFFTRAAEIVAKLWGTGMLVSQAQSYGALNGRQPSGVEVVLCEPQRYLEPLPVTAHLRSNLFNGLRLAYPGELAADDMVEFVLYALFTTPDEWKPLLDGQDYFELRLARRLQTMFPPAAVVTWRSISANTTCLFDDGRIYNQATSGHASADVGGYVDLPAADIQVLPARDQTVYVHDIRAMDAAIRAVLLPMLENRNEAGHEYTRVLQHNIRTNTEVLLFAERQYPRFLRIMPWARKTATAADPAIDVVRVNNGLAYYWMPQAAATSNVLLGWRQL